MPNKGPYKGAEGAGGGDLRNNKNNTKKKSHYYTLFLLFRIIFGFLYMWMIFLVHIIILILPIGQQMAQPNGSDMAADDGQPPEHEREGHGAADGEHAGALQDLADGDDGDGEADVGEDVRVPVEVEGDLPADGEVGDGGDAEEPEAQEPDEDADGGGEDAEDLDGGLAGAEDVVVAREIVRHADDGEPRERRGPHGDEHARARVRRGEAVLDQPRHVAGVDTDGHEQAEPLGAEAGDDDGDRLARRLQARAARRDRAREHEREDRQVPRRRHVRELQLRGREQQRVLSDREHERHGEVDPEEHSVGHDEPRATRRDATTDKSRRKKTVLDERKIADNYPDT